MKKTREMQKKSSFFFSFPSASNYGTAYTMRKKSESAQFSISHSYGQHGREAAKDEPHCLTHCGCLSVTNVTHPMLHL